MPLLVAGLWSNVPTGSMIQGNEEVLPTFTILTTDASPDLQWLHHRQPVFLWDIDLALQWLQNPTERISKKIADLAHSASAVLSWHPVDGRMSNLNYRESDSIKPIKIAKVPTVKSFFVKADAPNPKATMDVHFTASPSSPQMQECASKRCYVGANSTMSTCTNDLQVVEPKKLKKNPTSLSPIRHFSTTTTTTATGTTNDNEQERISTPSGLDPTVLAQLPPDIAKEVTQHERLYLQLSESKPKSNPQRGIESFFLKKS